VGRSAPLPAGTLTGADRSALGAFGHFQCFIHLYAKVSGCALKAAMTKQELYGPQVLRTPVDQGRLGAAPRMGVDATHVNRVLDKGDGTPSATCDSADDGSGSGSAGCRTRVPLMHRAPVAPRSPCCVSRIAQSLAGRTCSTPTLFSPSGPPKVSSVRDTSTPCPVTRQLARRGPWSCSGSS